MTVVKTNLSSPASCCAIKCLSLNWQDWLLKKAHTQLILQNQICFCIDFFWFGSSLSLHHLDRHTHVDACMPPSVGDGQKAAFRSECSPPRGSQELNSCHQDWWQGLSLTGLIICHGWLGTHCVYRIRLQLTEGHPPLLPRCRSFLFSGGTLARLAASGSVTEPDKTSPSMVPRKVTHSRRA